MSVTRRHQRRQQQSNTCVDGLADTACVIENMDQLPGPGTFSGRSNESGKNWLERFELWANCKGYSEDVRKAALALYLQESAATWLQVLSDAEKDTFPHLRTAFLKRYGVDQQPDWQRASQLWTLQQQSGESALDFIAKIQRAARDVRMTEELQCLAVINGLRPSIRAHVLRQNPADIASIRQAAVLAEQTESPVSTTDDRLARIEHQLQLLTVNSLDRDRRHEASHFDRRVPRTDSRESSASRSPPRAPAVERRSPIPSHDYDNADRHRVLVSNTMNQRMPPNDTSSSPTKAIVDTRAKISTSNNHGNQCRRCVPAVVVAIIVVPTATSGKPSVLTAEKWGTSHEPAVHLDARTADRSVLRAHRRQTGGLIAGSIDAKRRHRQWTTTPTSALCYQIQILFV